MATTLREALDSYKSAPAMAGKKQAAASYRSNGSAAVAPAKDFSKVSKKVSRKRA